MVTETDPLEKLKGLIASGKLFMGFYGMSNLIRF
jgi:hypothetical protein